MPGCRQTPATSAANRKLGTNPPCQDLTRLRGPTETRGWASSRSTSARVAALTCMRVLVCDLFAFCMAHIVISDPLESFHSRTPVPGLPQFRFPGRPEPNTQAFSNGKGGFEEFVLLGSPGTDRMDRRGRFYQNDGSARGTLSWGTVKKQAKDVRASRTSGKYVVLSTARGPWPAETLPTH